MPKDQSDQGPKCSGPKWLHSAHSRTYGISISMHTQNLPYVIAVQYQFTKCYRNLLLW